MSSKRKTPRNLFAVKRNLLAYYKKQAEERATAGLQQQKELWEDLHAYLEKTKSVGCSYRDYWTLYSHVRRQKPSQVLECGTGVSTLVLAHALKANQAETHKEAHIVSMEESTEWAEMSRRLMPAKFQNIEIVQSPKVEDYYSIFRGVRYAEVPARAYDFVFVDGPTLQAPSDGALTFNMDYIKLLTQSETPIAAIVDGRLINCYIYQKLLGADKVVYDAVHNMATVSPCSRHDLRMLRSASKTELAHSIKLFGRTVFSLELKPHSFTSEE